MSHFDLQYAEIPYDAIYRPPLNQATESCIKSSRLQMMNGFKDKSTCLSLSFLLRHLHCLSTEKGGGKSSNHSENYCFFPKL